MAGLGKVGKYIKDRANQTKVNAKVGTTMAMHSAGKSMVKDVPKNFFNAYTGKQTTAWTGAAFFAGAGIWGAATYHPAKDKAMLNSVQADYIGQAPVQNYDGVGNAPTLGATGSMVFGMHNSRRG